MDIIDIYREQRSTSIRPRFETLSADVGPISALTFDTNIATVASSYVAGVSHDVVDIASTLRYGGTGEEFPSDSRPGDLFFMSGTPYVYTQDNRWEEIQSISPDENNTVSLRENNDSRPVLPTIDLRTNLTSQTPYEYYSIGDTVAHAR